ncbi:unnamed protein product [Caretta caretta]
MQLRFCLLPHTLLRSKDCGPTVHKASMLHTQKEREVGREIKRMKDREKENDYKGRPGDAMRIRVGLAPDSAKKQRLKFLFKARL